MDNQLPDGIICLEKTFQAKSIQQILEISKSRHDYISTKIGVAPDFEKVSGTGKTNLYAFKGLLEFGIASTALDIGMNHKVITFLIDRAVKDDAQWEWEFFEKGSHITTLCFHYGFYYDEDFYYYTGCFKRQDFTTPRRNRITNEIVKFQKSHACIMLDLNEIKRRIIRMSFGTGVLKPLHAMG